MKADIEKFESGWYGLTLGIKLKEIDELIFALERLKENKEHFHFRSNYEGNENVGDIEVYYQTEDQNSNLVIERGNVNNEV